MAAASPRSYHSSTPPTYFSAVRGGGVTGSPSSVASGAGTTGMAAAASLVPPPPLRPSPEEDFIATNHSNSNSALNSTPYLQSRLTQLRSHSQDLSSELTKKLATSRSGQSLLHIGPSLSTLPPDLSSLLDALSPLLKDVQQYEAENRTELERLVNKGRVVQCTVRKRKFAVECAETYRELVGAEEVLQKEAGRRMVEDYGVGGEQKKKDEIVKNKGMMDLDLSDDEEEDDEDEDEELDHASSLERAAYTTLHLLQELQSSQAEVASITTGAKGGTSNDADGNDNDSSNMLPSLNDDSSLTGGINGVIMEKSRFLMKLAPRIRRLESDTAKCLVGRLESLLIKVRHLMENDGHSDGKSGVNKQQRSDTFLLMIGHTLRGLALLGKGADAESAFARVAVMPIVRARLSMGKLDEGGSRGECAGLFFLLDDIANTVRGMYGEILRSGEGMFATDVAAGSDAGAKMEVDLVTCGVWVPVATALMADPGIKMAIFSPGIANVLQANYSALDTFLSELGSSLLTPPPTSTNEEEKTSLEPLELGDFSHLYYKPKFDSQSIERSQSRLYAHPATVDYYKRWNLPIYYQLRFAEFCKRLDKALERVKSEGWQADVFTGEASEEKKLREGLGLELPVFLELYDGLLSMWKSNVFLRPLTHRFLRGAAQLVGRMLAFVKAGLDGEVEFGGSSSSQKSKGTDEDVTTLETLETIADIPSYRWNERVEDIAAVAWELTILDTCMSHDYLDAIAETVCPPDEESARSTHNSPIELDEIKLLGAEVLMESSTVIEPLVSHSWNTLIVDNLTSKCCAPLSAVKGVAATYRMTNRPPPTQASPFVATVLKPLKEFDTAYASRTPPQIGDDWKRRVISSVSDKYSAAVEELIATVKRTEEALKSRKTRKMMAGGMSDGEKVKLQLYLDHREFKANVEELGVDGEGIEGLVRLGQLTEEAEGLFLRTQQKK